MPLLILYSFLYHYLIPNYLLWVYHISIGDYKYSHVEEIDVPRTFEGIRDFLEKNNIEGIVFWKDGEPKCKIKRSDFGFTW